MDPFASALDWADLIRRREVSPVEVADLYLDRIERLDGELGAFVHRADDEVRAAAKRSADLVVETPGEDLPPFCGVPLPIKDLNPVAGWPCTYGSTAVPRGPAPASDPVVERFVAAGFVLLGMTASPELGTISFTESRAHGATRNPWDPGHTPGGSSGGAAAATASGMAPIAHASDGGGSIRIPASCCGLVGLKASRNRVVAFANVLEGLATSGVVSRTVADTAAVLDVISGPDPRSWYNAPPPDRSFAAQAAAAPGRLRVRYATKPPLDIPVDPACAAAVEATAAALAEAGHDVAEGALDIPDIDGMIAVFTTLWNTGSARIPGLDAAKLEPLNAALRAQGEATSSIAYVEAVLTAQAVTRELVGRMADEADVLLMPTMACLPPPVGAVWEGTDDDPMMALLNCYPMAVLTSLWNVTGLPAISLPVHQSPDGLPVGVQLVGGPWQDGLLLQVAAQVEQALPWADRRPPIS
jgi:amidase